MASSSSCSGQICVTSSAIAYKPIGPTIAKEDDGSEAFRPDEPTEHTLMFSSPMRFTGSEKFDKQVMSSSKISCSFVRLRVESMANKMQHQWTT